MFGSNREKYNHHMEHGRRNENFEFHRAFDTLQVISSLRSFLVRSFGQLRLLFCLLGIQL